jgi:hypothetical protein
MLARWAPYGRRKSHTTRYIATKDKMYSISRSHENHTAMKRHGDQENDLF